MARRKNFEDIIDKALIIADLRDRLEKEEEEFEKLLQGTSNSFRKMAETVKTSTKTTKESEAPKKLKNKGGRTRAKKNGNGHKRRKYSSRARALEERRFDMMAAIIRAGEKGLSPTKAKRAFGGRQIDKEAEKALRTLRNHGAIELREVDRQVGHGGTKVAQAYVAIRKSLPTELRA